MRMPEGREPVHIRMPPILRRAAEHRSPGPQRDAILRYAHELEEKGDATLVPRATFRAALDAFATEDDDEDDPTVQLPAGETLESRDMKMPDGGEPVHIRMPPILRRAAEHRSPGPQRDAILRYAHELEEKGDATLVPRATFRAALDAFATEDDDEDGL